MVIEESPLCPLTVADHCDVAFRVAVDVEDLGEALVVYQRIIAGEDFPPTKNRQGGVSWSHLQLTTQRNEFLVAAEVLSTTILSF